MRKLILLALVLTTAYSAYWFVGRSQVESGLKAALAEIDAGEYEVNYSDLRTIGYPSRFDTTISDLEFSEPTSRFTWRAPFFQLFALSYRPNEVIAFFPPEQEFNFDGEVLSLITRDMRASGKVSASTALALRNVTLEADNPRLRTEEGAELAMASLIAAMRLQPETSQTYDLFLEARSIVLPEALRTLADPEGRLPPLLQNLRFEGDLNLTEPIELNNVEGKTAQIAALHVGELALSWGDIHLSAIGDLTPDAQGLLNGNITFSARNWSQLMNLMAEAGIVPEGRRMLFEAVITQIDETPHISDTLTVTITIDDGQMALGPLPLGPAPRLR